MPVEFKIIASRGLTAVRMSGLILIDDIKDATQRYITSPTYRPGQKQFVDLSAVTGFEKDYASFIMLQASKAGRLADTRTQTLCVYYAPTEPGWELGMMFMRSWQDVHAVVPIIHRDEAESLSLLGMPEKTVAELMARAD